MEQERKHNHKQITSFYTLTGIYCNTHTHTHEFLSRKFNNPRLQSSAASAQRGHHAHESAWRALQQLHTLTGSSALTLDWQAQFTMLNQVTHWQQHVCCISLQFRGKKVFFAKLNNSLFGRFLLCSSGNTGNYHWGCGVTVFNTCFCAPPSRLSKSDWVERAESRFDTRNPYESATLL